MKRILALTLSLILVVGLLAGCGAKMAADSANGNAGYDRYESESVSGEAAPEDAGLTSESASSQGAAPINQKLVRKVWLTAETEDLDALLQQVDQKLAALGGYAEKREVYNGSSSATRRYRRASMTIRVPAEQLGNFVEQVTDISNIISSTESADDITLSYIATQSRITALETEQTRLLELLAKAENMDTLLKIESRLTDVRTELEQVTSQLRLYDNQVNYGTIYLELSEVKEYTVVEEPETVWDRIGEGFMQSLKDLGNFFTELFVFLVVGLPYLVLIGAVVVVIIVLWRLRRKKVRKAEQTDK